MQLAVFYIEMTRGCISCVCQCIRGLLNLIVQPLTQAVSSNLDNLQHFAIV